MFIDFICFWQTDAQFPLQFPLRQMEIKSGQDLKDKALSEALSARMPPLSAERT